MTLVTLGELLDAGVHFGHQSSRWNPKMFPYIYTEQNGIHVIDLVQTARLLTHAYNYVQTAAKEQKTFLFIGTKRQASAIIAEEAQKCGACYKAPCLPRCLVRSQLPLKSRRKDLFTPPFVPITASGLQG